jgi:DNA-binding MltR family transcriptional regulator
LSEESFLTPSIAQKGEAAKTEGVEQTGGKSKEPYTLEAPLNIDAWRTAHQLWELAIGCNMDSKILSAETLWKKAEDFYKAINEGSDLACVVISASYLDQCLASLLQKYFIESRISANVLDPKNGHLGTFSSRTDLSYCLGLIPKNLYQNLRVIAKICNAFAHIYPSKRFADPDVVNLCESLTFPRKCKAVTVTGNEKV